MLSFFPREPILTPEQIDRIADILNNAGQVILGVMVFSPFAVGFDKFYPFVVVLGIIGTLSCWILSILLSRKKK